MAEAANTQLHLQSFCGENVQHNAKQVYYVRSVFLGICGAASGVLGLTNLSGFYLYLASLVTVNASLLVINARLEPSAYLLSFNPTPVSPASARGAAASKLTKSSAAPPPPPPPPTASASSSFFRSAAWAGVKFLFEGAQDMLFSYILWWTLFTALVHVYD